MRWGDVDLDLRRLSARQGLVAVGYALSSRRRKRRARCAPSPSTRSAWPRSHRAAQAAERLSWGPSYEDQGLVFAKENGEPLHPQSVSRAFERAARRAGLASDPHDLRPNYGSAALRAGEDPKVVSERLGHSSIGITLDTYSHLIGVVDEGPPSGWRL